MDSAELERLLDKRTGGQTDESDRIERTESFKKFGKFGEAVCAFANDRLNVQKHALGGGELAVVEVFPSTAPPVRYKGQVWVRIGPSRRIATEAEERELSERRAASARTFDARPCHEATLDVGPNLGAINRAALVAAESVVVPLAPDLFSLRGLKNLGPKLREWQSGWSHRELQGKGKVPKGIDLPGGQMRPIGYVVLQHSVRQDAPLKAHQRWLERIPETYRTAVQNTPPRGARRVRDPEMLGLLKNYRSLMPLAHDARKPVFALLPADGVIGGTSKAVSDARADFEALAREIARRIGLELD